MTVNTIIINGISIIYPNDLVLTVNDKQINIAYNTKSMMLIPQEEREEGHRAPPTPTRPLAKSIRHIKLPANFEELVLGEIERLGGKAYSNSLGKMIAEHMGLSKMQYPTSVAVKHRLGRMVDNGLLVDLKNTKQYGGQPLYAWKQTHIDNDTEEVSNE